MEDPTLRSGNSLNKHASKYKQKFENNSDFKVNFD